MVERLKITKSTVDRLPLHASARVITWDSTLSGFGVRVGKSKVYFAQKKVNGKLIRVTLGKHGQITPDQARKMAQAKLAELSAGINPNFEKRQARAKGVTLQEVFDDFLIVRKSLKPRTIADYKRFMKVYFKNWQTKPAASITRLMVEKRHRYIGKDHGGEAQANLSMRFLRSLFNFAIAKYNDDPLKPIIPENPVKALSQTRAWYTVTRRQTVVKTRELAALFDGMDKLEKTVGNSKPEAVRDYLTLIIFTGLRRNEAATLKWSDVDFKEKTFTVVDTKNKRPLNLPLSDYLCDLLKRRHKDRVNDYIFPGTGKAGHLVEPKKQIAKIKESSKLSFGIHDLRRTFITIAESLDIPHYAIKKLVNHSTGEDVTAGYIIHDVERLRKPMQKITDFILQKAGRSEEAEVIELHKGKKAG